MNNQAWRSWSTLYFLSGLSEVQVTWSPQSAQLCMEQGHNCHLGVSTDSGYLESVLYLSPPGVVFSTISHGKIWHIMLSYEGFSCMGI